MNERVAIVLVAHGDRGGTAGDAGIHAHAAALTAAGGFAHVGVGLLKGEPTIEDALRRAAATANRVRIVPVMMAEGYFTRVVLPARIAAAGVTAPVERTGVLGLCPEIPALVAEAAEAVARAAGWAPADAILMVVGHGSAIGPDARVPVDRVVAALAPAGRFRRVVPAFVEESPTLDEAVAALDGPTIVASLLASDGLHGQDDLSEALEVARVPVARTGALGSSPLVRPVIERLARERDATFVVHPFELRRDP